MNPLTPEPWWDRPVEHWLARQLCQYAHLSGGERFGWVLVGTVVGRGPDSEPLVRDGRAVARLADGVLGEAARLYGEVFAPGRVEGLSAPPGPVPVRPDRRRPRAPLR